MPNSLKLTVINYDESLASEWDNFVKNARNSTFLHERSYMDYHKDRFPDCSLMIYLDNFLIALLPASRKDLILTSHAGLTYGGLIMGRAFHASYAVAVFNAVREWCLVHGINGLLYKPIPHIYHRMPAEEDLYAINLLGGRLIRRDLSTSIRLRHCYERTKGRKAAVKKAKAAGIKTCISTNYYEFMQIESRHLMDKHGVMPVHSVDEIEFLARNFPNNIKLYCAYLDREILGGVIVYLTDTTCHAQYIGATVQGKRLGAIDACIDEIISSLDDSKEWFDFGISTTDNGNNLDQNLMLNKESWGGRSTIYDHYEWIFK